MNKQTSSLIAIILLASMHSSGYATDQFNENEKAGARTNNAMSGYERKQDQLPTCRYPYFPRERKFIGYDPYTDDPRFREKGSPNTTFVQRFWEVFGSSQDK
jgi:hypothetical protein